MADVCTIELGDVGGEAVVALTPEDGDGVDGMVQALFVLLGDALLLLLQLAGDVTRDGALLLANLVAHRIDSLGDGLGNGLLLVLGLLLLRELL